MATHIFNQIHIDVARNATDDFNLFHDKNKWKLISSNPFNGPIVLGFQLESLIEYDIGLYRKLNNEDKIILQNNLRFSNYQFSFANAVKPDQEVRVEIKKSQYQKGENCTLSNRVSVRSKNRLDLIGFKKESQFPLFMPEVDPTLLSGLANAPDRSFIGDSGLFLKRKFMNTSNAKNFLSGSLAEQADYFDELEGKANFPEIFPCGLISCALLEKALLEKHDFQQNPMVYTAHKITIDREALSGLKSNDILHILVRQINADSSGNGRINRENTDRIYECYGVVGNGTLLFGGIISLAYLANILDSFHKNRKRH
jgi:hypothetical protein